MTTEDEGARSARPTSPGETVEAAIPTIEHPDPDESIIRLWQERGRLTAEADRTLTLAGDEDSDDQPRVQALDDKATEIEKRIAIITPNGPTGWALQVALLALWRERGTWPTFSAPYRRCLNWRALATPARTPRLQACGGSTGRTPKSGAPLLTTPEPHTPSARRKSSDG